MNLGIYSELKYLSLKFQCSLVKGEKKTNTNFIPSLGKISYQIFYAEFNIYFCNIAFHSSNFIDDTKHHLRT